MEVPEIDVDELARMRSAGVPLIDVRQPDEYEEAHVPGAVLIPLADLPERVDEVPVDGVVPFICSVGSRSRRAAEFLRRQGVDAINVAGGTKAWLEAGFDVATGEDPG